MKLKRYFYSSVAIILNGVCMLLGTTQLLRLENKIEFHHLISCAHWSLHSISFLSQQTPKAQLCKDMTSLKGMWWPYIETMSYLKPALHTLANRSWSFLCLEKKKKGAELSHSLPMYSLWQAQGTSENNLGSCKSQAFPLQATENVFPGWQSHHEEKREREREGSWTQTSWACRVK